MSKDVRYTADMSDGSQVLMVVYIDDEGQSRMTVATRPERHSTWGPPRPLELAPSERDVPRGTSEGGR